MRENLILQKNSGRKSKGALIKKEEEIRRKHNMWRWMGENISHVSHSYTPKPPIPLYSKFCARSEHMIRLLQAARLQSVAEQKLFWILLGLPDLLTCKLVYKHFF